MPSLNKPSNEPTNGNPNRCPNGVSIKPAKAAPRCPSKDPQNGSQNRPQNEYINRAPNGCPNRPLKWSQMHPQMNTPQPSPRHLMYGFRTKNFCGFREKHFVGSVFTNLVAQICVVQIPYKMQACNRGPYRENNITVRIPSTNRGRNPYTTIWTPIAFTTWPLVRVSPIALASEPAEGDSAGIFETLKWIPNGLSNSPQKHGSKYLQNRVQNQPRHTPLKWLSNGTPNKFPNGTSNRP